MHPTGGLIHASLSLVWTDARTRTLVVSPTPSQNRIGKSARCGGDVLLPPPHILGKLKRIPGSALWYVAWHNECSSLSLSPPPPLLLFYESILASLRIDRMSRLTCAHGV